jgi:hypothetical protein
MASNHLPPIRKLAVVKAQAVVILVVLLAPASMFVALWVGAAFGNKTCRTLFAKIIGHGRPRR